MFMSMLMSRHDDGLLVSCENQAESHTILRFSFTVEHRYTVFAKL